jgi:ABC-type antimicrobial peptide transport system permease subunit
MLTTEFVGLVLLANFMALPAAYYFLRDWLHQYPYRVDFDITVFVGTALISICVSVLAVGFQAIRAASSNPVDSLRYE